MSLRKQPNQSTTMSRLSPGPFNPALGTKEEQAKLWKETKEKMRLIHDKYNDISSEIYKNCRIKNGDHILEEKLQKESTRRANVEAGIEGLPEARIEIEKLENVLV